VCEFCLSDLSKTFAIQKGTNIHNINDNWGREIVHSKLKIIIALLCYTPIQLSIVGLLQMSCQFSGQVLPKSNFQRFH